MVSVRRPLLRGAAQPTLAVSLLGPPRIERGDRVVPVDTRKAIAILAYLAVTGHRQPRERLAAMFWPEADAERARGALRRTLSSLRTALGGQWLQTEGISVGLEADGVRLDVADFRRALKEGRLEDAVAAYGGDFLAGFALRDSPEFDEWQGEQEAALRRELADALDRLVEREARAGRAEAAIEHARRRLALDPLNEPTHRELMRLYAHRGDRAAALRQYAECVRLLDTELGVAPMPETKALYEEIRSGSLAAAGQEIRPAVLPLAGTAAAAARAEGTAGLHEALGDVYALHGAYDKAVGSYEDALAAAAEEQRPRVAHKLAHVHHRRGDWDKAERRYRAAADAEREPGLRARILADWSLAAHRRGDPSRAQRLVTRALSIAEDSRDERALAQAHNILGVLAGGRGDHARARQHLEHSLELAARSGDEDARIAALNNLAIASRRAGDLERARELTDEALGLSAQSGDRHREAALHNNLADVLHAMGQRQEAMRHLKRAVALFSEIGGDREPEVWKLAEW